MHLSCAAEGDFVAHSAAMLHSAITCAAPGPVQVHYLHGPDLSRRSARRLRRMVERLGAAISFLEIANERCAGLPTEGFTGKATWYKLFLPEMLPHAERVLALDVDVIVMGSLAPLWATPLEGSYLAAVTNVLPPWYADRPAAVGLSSPRDYFNAGVLLMNLDRMRSDRCSEAMHTYGVEHADDLVLRDQDAMNAVLSRGRVTLHPRWNCMNALFLYPESDDVLGAAEAEQARREPAIRHFEGPDQNKPWSRECRQPHRDAYLAHRRATSWRFSR